MNVIKRKRIFKQLKRDTGKSQNAIARELGISHAYLSAIVNCKRRPSLPLAFKLQDVTGIPAQEFAEVA